MYLAIIILPLLGSIASGFFGRKIGVSGAQIITCTAVVTTTILAVLAFFEVGLNNIPVSIEVFRWIDSESLNVSWGFHFDSLTVCYVAILIEIEAVLVWIQLYKNMFILWISRLVMSDKTKNNPAYLPCPSNSYGLKGFRCKYPFTSTFPNRKKIHYSTINNIKKTEQEIGAINPEFLQWFVGFTDAEGSFTINSHLKKDKFTISSFSFMFKIALPFSTSATKGVRFASTLSNSSSTLNPFWVTGFVDAEGCFIISVRSQKGKTGWRASAIFFYTFTH